MDPGRTPKTPDKVAHLFIQFVVGHRDDGISIARMLSRGHMLADVSAIIGSLDIVFGEIDR
jgi:hypothetical protein